MQKNKYNRLAAVMVEEDIDNGMLAEHLGVSVETVSKWRNNKSQPSLIRLYDIAAFFKIDVCLFLAQRTWEPGLSDAELLKKKAEEQKKKARKKGKK